MNLFPEYARSKRADAEALSQLVLAAKGNMTMKKFANKCGVNTSTISRIINMKMETVCSDEVILAISENAAAESGVTLEALLAANGMVKLVPDITGRPIEDAGSMNEGEQEAKHSGKAMAVTKKIEIDGQMVEFRASAAVPRLYRIKFGRDIYKDLRSLEKSVDDGNEESSSLDLFSLEMFENIAYIMAKHAHPDQVPDTPDEWLENFNTFSIYQILPQLIELWGLNVQTEVEARKNLAKVSG